MECVEDGGGSRIASAEFAGEVEGVGNSEAGEVRAEKQEARRQERIMRTSKRKRNAIAEAIAEMPLAVRTRERLPYEFVLDALAPLSPWTRPMFGCLAVYVRDRIVLILREKVNESADNGVWLATTREHHASLLLEFPNMRSIRVLGKDVTGWQVLPADAPDFEEAATHACELIVARDARIGKVPGSRRSTRNKSKGRPLKAS